MSWTPERVEILKKFWADGQSMSFIAKEMGEGATRNSVIGKIHRLGLCARDGGRDEAARQTGREPGQSAQPRQAARPQQPRVKAARPKPAATAPISTGYRPRPIIVQSTPPVMPETEHVGHDAIHLLQAGVCKWPVGDPTLADFRFCGCKSSVGQSYCDYHYTLAYQPSKPSAQRNFERSVRRIG
jgi:GcrA cell cycle regulator